MLYATLYYDFLANTVTVFEWHRHCALRKKKKEFRCPLNLLIVNQCCYGIVSNLSNGFLVLIAIPISLGYGSCAIEPKSWWQQPMQHTLELALSISLRSQLEYTSHWNTTMVSYSHSHTGKCSLNHCDCSCLVISIDMGHNTRLHHEKHSKLKMSIIYGWFWATQFCYRSAWIIPNCSVRFKNLFDWYGLPYTGCRYTYCFI